jgi:putative oxidoreductase
MYMLDFIDNKYTMAIGRVMLVVIYFMGGMALFTGGVPVEYAAAKGIPAALTWIGYGIKFFGGLAVIVGYQTRIAALLLVVFTVATAFIFHAPWVAESASTFWKEISMIGGLLILAVVGPGDLSIDGRSKS